MEKNKYYEKLGLILKEDEGMDAFGSEQTNNVNPNSDDLNQSSEELYDDNVNNEQGVNDQSELEDPMGEESMMGDSEMGDQMGGDPAEMEMDGMMNDDPTQMGADAEGNPEDNKKLRLVFLCFKKLLTQVLNLKDAIENIKIDMIDEKKRIVLDQTNKNLIILEDQLNYILTKDFKSKNFEENLYLFILIRNKFLLMIKEFRLNFDLTKPNIDKK